MRLEEELQDPYRLQREHWVVCFSDKIRQQKVTRSVLFLPHVPDPARTRRVAMCILLREP